MCQNGYPILSIMCQYTPHIWLYFDRCEDLGLTEIKPGTNSLDAECEKKHPVALIAGVIAGVLTVLSALFFVIRRRCSHRGKFHINLNKFLILLLNVYISIN